MATYPTNPPPTYEFSESLTIPVSVTRYPNGTEQRIGTTTQAAREFTLRYETWASSGELDPLWNFYLARWGQLESFNYVSVRDGQNYIVRFDMGDISRDQFEKVLEKTGIKLIQVFGETPAP